MQRATKPRIAEFIAPFVLGLGLIIKTLYRVIFGWWLDPLSQQKQNWALRDDVRANLAFLASEGEFLNSQPVAILPFDYASVKLSRENVLFTITRGRGELNVSVSPRHIPAETHELGRVIAALECRHLSEKDLVNDWGGIERLLRPRLTDLNRAFSEREYLHLKERL